MGAEGLYRDGGRYELRRASGKGRQLAAARAIGVDQEDGAPATEELPLVRIGQVRLRLPVQVFEVQRGISRIGVREDAHSPFGKAVRPSLPAMASALFWRTVNGAEKVCVMTMPDIVTPQKRREPPGEAA